MGDAVLGVHEECEDDFIARCARGYNEIDEKPYPAPYGRHEWGHFPDFQRHAGTGWPRRRAYYFRRRLWAEEHQKKLAERRKA